MTLRMKHGEFGENHIRDFAGLTRCPELPQNCAKTYSIVLLGEKNVRDPRPLLG